MQPSSLDIKLYQNISAWLKDTSAKTFSSRVSELISGLEEQVLDPDITVIER
jgi:hypothetical protein